MNRTSKDTERGAAFLEFALVAPVLLLLIFSMFELSIIYTAREDAAVLTKAYGKHLFRECKTLSEDFIEGCLEQAETDINDLGFPLDTAEIILSVYEHDGTTVSRLGVYPADAKTASDTYNTKYKATGTSTTKTVVLTDVDSISSTLHN